MPPLARKLKIVTLDIGGENFEVQLKEWKLADETDEAEKGYTFAPDGEYVEEADELWNLEMIFLSDWRVNGVSDYFAQHHNQVVPFQLDHRPDVPAERVRWVGNMRIRHPSVGGEARTTELTEITVPLINFDPLTAYSRP